MLGQGSVMRSVLGEMLCFPILIEGVNDANPTKKLGRGVTITRVAEGQYRFTWGEYPGTFLGAVAQFCENAPVAGDGKLSVVDYDSWTVTGLALDIFIEDPGTEAAAPAMSDLIAGEHLFVMVWFAMHGPVE